MGCGCKGKAAAKGPRLPATRRVLIGLIPWLGMYWVGYPWPLRVVKTVTGRRRQWVGCGCHYRAKLAYMTVRDGLLWAAGAVRGVPRAFVPGNQDTRVPLPPEGSRRERLRAYTGPMGKIGGPEQPKPSQPGIGTTTAS